MEQRVCNRKGKSVTGSRGDPGIEAERSRSTWRYIGRKVREKVQLEVKWFQRVSREKG